VKALLLRPHGMVLVTGPTGSGKTTTLYAALSLLSSIEKNIVTIEDPVEYQLEIVSQIQVKEAVGFTFPKILRSALRQDPDIIMVGEIRDDETTRVAVQAALTGHLVLATLHTNESVGAVARLLDMGIEPYLLASTLTGVISQRLVRLVCAECCTSHFPPRELLSRIGWHGENISFSVGKGCSKCFDSGLRGRQGIFELFEIDEVVRQAILRNPSIDELRELHEKSGTPTLKDEAFRLAEEGVTSLDEAMRVVFVGQEPEHKALAYSHAQEVEL